MGDVTRSYQVGQVYTAHPAGQEERRLVRMLVRRLGVDEDFRDGWGHKGGKTPYGWYWYCLDLLTGEECVTIDNQFDHWERLV